MALGPISSVGAAPAPPVSPSRDVTNAQRAFFQTALGQVTSAAPVVAPKAEPARASDPEPPATQTEAPKAVYRPGSLLDIKI